MNAIDTYRKYETEANDLLNRLFEVQKLQHEALGAAILETGALKQLLWNLEGIWSNELRQADFKSDAAKDAMSKINGIWRHDYHDLTNIDAAGKIVLRFDDFEYSLRFSSSDLMREFIKKHGLLIDSKQFNVAIENAEKKLQELKVARQELDDWLK